MSDEKTLLQQIRDKEQQVSKKIDAVKAETENVIAIAKRDAEKVVAEAQVSGKSAADDLYTKKKAAFIAETEEMKKTAALQGEAIKATAEKNIGSAVELIVSRVTKSR